MSAAMVEFDLVFNVLEDVKTKPFLLVFNKYDSTKDFVDKYFIESFFNITEMLDQYQNLNVIYSSALNDYNVKEIYLWISNVLSGKFNS